MKHSLFKRAYSISELTLLAQHDLFIDFVLVNSNSPSFPLRNISVLRPITKDFTVHPRSKNLSSYFPHGDFKLKKFTHSSPPDLFYTSVISLTDVDNTHFKPRWQPSQHNGTRSTLHVVTCLCRLTFLSIYSVSIFIAVIYFHLQKCPVGLETLGCIMAISPPSLLTISGRRLYRSILSELFAK